MPLRAQQDDSAGPDEPIQDSLASSILSQWVHGGPTLKLAGSEQGAAQPSQEGFVSRQQQLITDYSNSWSTSAQSPCQQQHSKAVEAHMKLFPKLMRQFHELRSRQLPAVEDVSALTLPDILHQLLLGLPAGLKPTTDTSSADRAGPTQPPNSTLAPKAPLSHQERQRVADLYMFARHLLDAAVMGGAETSSSTSQAASSTARDAFDVTARGSIVAGGESADVNPASSTAGAPTVQPAPMPGDHASVSVPPQPYPALEPLFKAVEVAASMTGSGSRADRPRSAAASRSSGRCMLGCTLPVIFHPGEVNKIREMPAHPNVVTTHTDTPELCVWNVDKQPNRSRAQARGKGAADSVPDLQLTGHKDEALFPLATTPAGPAVASGGNDQLVLVWSLVDHVDGPLAGAKGGSAGAKSFPTLAARSRLEGHTKAVEEVVFKPGTTQELASADDDAQLLFWDCRTGSSPVVTMANAHGPNQDVQCVDWSALAEHCVATGAQDGSVKVWDVRHMRSPEDTLASLNSHTDAIIRLEWHSHSRGILASGGDDKVVMLWRIDPAATPGAPSPAGGGNDIASRASALRARKGGQAAPTQGALIMQHSGHRRGKVVDFQWCPTVPWAIMSVSDDSADEDVAGGSLQAHPDFRQAEALHTSVDNKILSHWLVGVGMGSSAGAAVLWTASRGGSPCGNEEYIYGIVQLPGQRGQFLRSDAMVIADSLPACLACHECAWGNSSALGI